MNETTDSPDGPARGPAPDPQSGPRTDWDQVKDVRGLQRPVGDRMVAGVAAGLARHLNIDPLVLRVAFVVLSFFGGAGVIVYGALWLLLPEDGATQAPIHLDERSRGVALIGVLAVASLALIGDSWGLYWFPWPLAVLAVVVWYFWNRSSKGGSHGGHPLPHETPQAPQAPQASQASQAPAYATAAAAGPPTQHGEAWAHHGWTPPPPATVHRPPLTRPRDPRRRGPVLFWFTLALTALALGVLGTVDLAGASVATSAYPALAMTIAGAMLVLGAFWGRAGGIILIALVAGAATILAMANEHVQRGDLLFEPTTASEVRDSYELHSGALTLDLTGITDPDGLDGRDITVDGGAGRIEIRLPAGLNYEVDADVGVGSIRLPQRGEVGGLGATSRATSSAAVDGPAIRIEANLGVGEVVVTHSEAPVPRSQP